MKTRGSPGDKNASSYLARGPRRSCWLVEDYNLRNECPRVADVHQPVILAKRGEVLLYVT